MCHDGRPDIRRYAPDPAFLGARGLQPPGGILSPNQSKASLGRSPYNDVPCVLINPLCALVDFPDIPVDFLGIPVDFLGIPVDSFGIVINPLGSLVDVLLYRCLSKTLDRSRGGLRNAYLVVRDCIS